MSRSKDILVSNSVQIEQPTVSDIVVEFFEKIGLSHIFLLSGGGIMYLLDAVGRAERLDYVCNFHEQACAISADAYARMNGFGACMVTFGPGAVNALSGVVGAWYDSVPMMVVSGQVRSAVIADYSKVRQVGPQEGNVMAMVEPVTKYSVSLRKGEDILYELEKAYHLAKSGRPGPVWIEIPLDVQAERVDRASLRHFVPPTASNPLSFVMQELVSLFVKASKPVLVLGNGVRLASMHAEVMELIKSLRIPVLVPYTGKDLIADDNMFGFGVFGTAGQRQANIILQSADLVLGLGVGFCVAKTGFAVDKFAANATKVIVDIDEGQLSAHLLKADVPIRADLREFVPQLRDALRGQSLPSWDGWIALCGYWKERYPMVSNAQATQSSFVNSYQFMERLSHFCAQDDTIVTGNGLDCVSFYQGFRIKGAQRAALNGNWGSMGWDLPMAVGAHFATKGRVICIAGDGGVMLNLQELLTIGANQLPVKVFVFNNEGYGSIKATQDTFFEKRYVGAEPGSKVFNPDFSMIAKAFDVPFARIADHSELDGVLAEVLASAEPALIEVMISPAQWIAPKATSFKNSEGKIESKPLDDMFPFLSDDEVADNRRRAAAVVAGEFRLID
jgi:acetolactate synthase I/II/III large subunit